MRRTLSPPSRGMASLVAIVARYDIMSVTVRSLTIESGISTPDCGAEGATDRAWYGATWRFPMTYADFNFSAPQAKPAVSRTVYQAPWIEPGLTGELAVAALTDLFGADELVAMVRAEYAVKTANFCRKSAENGVPLADILTAVKTWKPGTKPMTDEEAAVRAALAKVLGVDPGSLTPEAIRRIKANAGITEHPAR